MQTIAQQLKVTDFPFRINDKNGRTIYFEDSDGDWYRFEYDLDGNEIYLENNYKYWAKKECDPKGNRIYFENSNGLIVDKRPKTEVEKALYLLEKEGMLVEGKIIKN